MYNGITHYPVAAFRSSGGRMRRGEGWRRFKKNKMASNIPINITCKFGINLLKIHSFIAFLLKNCQRGQITAGSQCIYIYRNCSIHIL
jgi:hypothetical protein